jgi:CubicO group peptidase (beta-lactamase class C family)
MSTSPVIEPYLSIFRAEVAVLQRLQSTTLMLWILITAVLMLTACGGSSSSSDSSPPPGADPISILESDIRNALDNVITDTDFTLLVSAPNGRTFSHSIGTSTATTSYQSASTSKMVTGAVILRLVNDGVLSLDDNPQDFVGSWPSTGNLSQIQLRHLLAFTSGLNFTPSCTNNPFTTLSACVDQIAADNTSAPVPGTEFYYGSAHMQVAGLMAMNAVGASSWGEIFNDFKTDTGLFANGVFDLPSLQNPRLAGGMHWIATDFLAFLQALHEQSILSPMLIAEMTSNQNLGATIVSTPIAFPGQDWRYGLGGWIECQAPVFNCTTISKFSSPGAYGAYPFIDFEHGYYGIVARQGSLGSGSMGYAVFSSVESQLQAWAALNQE